MNLPSIISIAEHDFFKIHFFTASWDSWEQVVASYRWHHFKFKIVYKPSTSDPPLAKAKFDFNICLNKSLLNQRRLICSRPANEMGDVKNTTGHLPSHTSQFPVRSHSFCGGWSSSTGDFPAAITLNILNKIKLAAHVHPMSSAAIHNGFVGQMSSQSLPQFSSLRKASTFLLLLGWIWC